MIKKLLAIILAFALVVSLSACGGSEEAAEGASETSAEDGFVIKNDDSVELGTPEKTLKPDEVYKKIKYTPEMFFGDYQIKGGKEAQEKFGKETEYATYTIGGEEENLSVLPFQIQGGKHTYAHVIHSIKKYNWMNVYFMNKSETSVNLDFMFCAYTIEGNKLILTPLDTYSYDDKTKKITYGLSDIKWEYEFSFKGRELTLSSGEHSITLTGGLDPYGEHDYFATEAYLSAESEAAKGIDQMDFLCNAEDGAYNRFYLETITGEKSYNSIAKLEENGLFTVTVVLEEGTKTYQYVYFYCGEDGMVLTDGTNTYYYNDNYSDRNRTDINQYIIEDQTGKAKELTDAELEAIIEKKEDLMEDLVSAFESKGIKVSVNSKTGEISMDSSVLFGGDSSELSSEGKTFLNKFVEAYTSIVFSDKYKGFVKKTIIEGHTAPVAGSTYESGLPLSKERAKVVKEYCVSKETGVDTSKLASTLEAKGYSNSKPIKDINGNVDMEASRRVSFRFIINLESK